MKAAWLWLCEYGFILVINKCPLWCYENTQAGVRTHKQECESTAPARFGYTHVCAQHIGWGRVSLCAAYITSITFHNLTLTFHWSFQYGDLAISHVIPSESEVQLLSRSEQIYGFRLRSIFSVSLVHCIDNCMYGCGYKAFCVLRKVHLFTGPAKAILTHMHSNAHMHIHTHVKPVNIVFRLLWLIN